MGLVTDHFTSLSPNPKERPRKILLGPAYSSATRTTMQSGWHHAVYRFRKWLRTTLTAHGEHGDGLTH